MQIECAGCTWSPHLSPTQGSRDETGFLFRYRERPWLTLRFFVECVLPPCDLDAVPC